MSPFFKFDAHLGQPNSAVGCYRACIGHPTGKSETEAQLCCTFAAFACSEYGHLSGHQRTLRVTIVTTARRMPTIQKRAVILLSGMPPF